MPRKNYAIIRINVRKNAWNWAVHLQRSGEFDKRMIGRPVAQRQFEGVTRVVASFAQPAREPARKLRIDQKFHAGIGSVRLTRVSFAANPNAARMSARSRSG